MMFDGGGEGIVILLLVRVKKRKVRRAKIFHQRKNGEKTNQIIQTINQHGKKSIIIITIVRMMKKEFNIIII